MIVDPMCPSRETSEVVRSAAGAVGSTAGARRRDLR
jgi:hypothetical protein